MSINERVSSKKSAFDRIKPIHLKMEYRGVVSLIR